MAEYTEAFAAFILEAKDAFDDLCAEIDAGNVPAGNSATVRITVPVVVVDRIRFDRLAAAAQANGNGDGEH